MSIDTVVTLIDALRSSHLLDDEQLAALERDAPAKYGQPRDLAVDLINRGWLTKYQAKQVLHGRGEALILGPYRLLERLGAGGMGQVFKALHQPMNRIVALKVVRPELVADPRTLKRFRREVQAAAQLNHPNIVTVFDAAQIGNMHFLAMEYIDGSDLSELVRASGPLPVATACDYIRQAALGLQHAHERGMVHRDVKPGNLLVTCSAPAGVIKILDMGLARPTSIEGLTGNVHSSLTVDGTVVGTPDFMSPEQAKNSSNVDHRADIYSLGCTHYFLLTGRLTFPSGNVMEKLIQHQVDEPFPIEMLRSDLPAGLPPILQKMMAKRPEDRYPSAHELAAALESFCAPGAMPPVAEVIPVVAAAAGGDATTPANATATSPFNFEPPPKPNFAALRVSRSARRAPLLAGIVAAAALVGLLLIAGIIVAARAKKTPPGNEPQSTQPTTATTVANLPATFPPKPSTVSPAPLSDEVLAACIPERAAFVLVVNMRQFLQARAFEKHFGPSLQPHLDNLEQLNVDPRKQCDRLVVSILPGKPQRVLAVLTGSYMSEELQEFMGTILKLEPHKFDDDIEIPLAEVKGDRGQKQFVGILQNSFVAIATDQKLLWEAEVRLRDRHGVSGHPLARKFPKKNPEPSIQFAITGAFVPEDEPLEKAGVNEVIGDITVTERIEMDALTRVKDPAKFREQLRHIGQSLTTGAIFDVRLALPATLLRTPAIETGAADDGGLTEVRIRKTVPPRDLDVILSALVKRLAVEEKK